MGLHLCYELRLPGDTPEAHVAEVLERLRERACALMIDRVSPMFRLSLDELRQHRAPSWTSLDWYFHLVASGILQERDDASAYAMHTPDRAAAIGFAVHPGRGCEAAGFGFIRPLLTDPPQESERAEEWNAWFWHACCKTQYASVVSDDHLVHCHLALVELLEECARLGIEVTVHDETGYWETRSTEHLIREVEKMNRIVARFAGAMHDAMPAGHRVEGSIFEHPDFERLETRGRAAD
jgi:hypothetical protein